eukprot:scaffold156805_cov41-Prasinocladus_malaysianus.AAC.1
MPRKLAAHVRTHVRYHKPVSLNSDEAGKLIGHLAQIPKYGGRSSLLGASCGHGTLTKVKSDHRRTAAARSLGHISYLREPHSIL